MGESIGKLLLKSPPGGELIMSYTGLTADGLGGLADQMPDTCSLKKVEASGNSTLLESAAGGEAMAKILVKSHQFEDLAEVCIGFTTNRLSGFVDQMPDTCSLNKFEASRNHTLLKSAAGGEAMGKIL